VPGSLVAHFSIFRRPRTADDVTPSRLLATGLIAKLALRPSESRLAGSLDSVSYVVPGREVVCAFVGDQATAGCWPMKTALGALATDTTLCAPQLPPHTLETVGLMPDGIRSVTLAGPHGSVRVRVVRNVFVARISSTNPPLRMSWMIHGHRVIHPTGVPANAAKMGCGGPPPTEMVRPRAP